MQQVLKAAIIAGLVSGCSISTLKDAHGFVPRDEDVADIRVGQDTKDTVSVLLGNPGSTGVVSENIWFYVSSNYETFAWRRPNEVEREILAISFTDREVVSNIERFGLEDGQIILLDRRITETGTVELNIVQEVLGNFGVVSADQFLPQ